MTVSTLGSQIWQWYGPLQFPYPCLVSTYSAGQVFTITVQISWSGSPITDFTERTYSMFGLTASIKDANGQKVLQIIKETLLPHSKTNNIAVCKQLRAVQLHLHHQEEKSQTNKLLKIQRSTGYSVLSKQAKTFLNSSYLFGIIHGSYFLFTILDFGES